MIFAGVSCAILVTLVLAIARAIKGPTVYDRLLAVNMFGRADFLDLALAYALINLVGVLAVLEFFQNRIDANGDASGD